MTARGRKQSKWSPEKVVQTIRTLYERGEDISPKAIKMNNNKLMMAARHYYGSWQNAVRAAGIEYEKTTLRVVEKWTKEKILEGIINAMEHNEELFKKPFKYNRKLYGAAKYHFGTWDTAVLAARIYKEKKKIPKFKKYLLVFPPNIHPINILREKTNYFFSVLSANEEGVVIECPDYYEIHVIFPEAKMITPYGEHFERIDGAKVKVGDIVEVLAGKNANMIGKVITMEENRIEIEIVDSLIPKNVEECVDNIRILAKANKK